VFSGLSLAEMVKRLDAAGIANASVNDMQRAWKHPQLQARDRWISVKTPVGDVPALKSPGLWFAGAISAVPAVGEHSRSILSELGYREEQFGQLEQQGVI
jgi:crotonobetainyl-CoA:carnitine CoA-transferase CaiB-like acyl-CoA transferase